MKQIFVITALIVYCNFCYGQNYNIQQNQQNVNINVPVIEKKVYVDRYRTVFVEKPRKERKLSEPVLLLGYLYVFPEDIGDFQVPPIEIIKAVNRQNLFGCNTWRIPTPDELRLMEANADQLGMGDYIYMATSHANGHLRLVSTGMKINNNDDIISKGEGKKIGNLIWSTINYGAKSPFELGLSVTPFEFRDNIKCPDGWRLPTKFEFKLLLKELTNVRGYRTQNSSWKWYLSGMTDTGWFYLPLEGYLTSWGSRLATCVKANYLTEDDLGIEINMGVTFDAESSKEIDGQSEIYYKAPVYRADDLEGECRGNCYVRFVRDL